MKVGIVLMPWYRRESPSPELALSIALLRKQNHKVYAYDLNNEMFRRQYKKRGFWKFFLLDAPDKVRDDFFEETREIFEYFAAQILSQDPEVIIFKTTGRTYHCSAQMARILKQKNAAKTVIFTGLLFPSRDEEETFIKGRENCFDFAILGEDEIALPKLMEALANNNAHRLGYSLEKDGKVINYIRDAVVEDLDTLPFYDFSDFDLDAYKFPDKLEIFISKGCIWRCSFCVDWLVEKKYRSMSGERIYKEILYQLAIHKNRQLRFCDKTINGNVNALSTFCDLLLEGYRKGSDEMSWSGDVMIRPEMTKELLTKMHQAGCRGLGYGLESGSQDVLEKMGKRFSITLAEKVLGDTHHVGIHVDVNILVGFPTETQADFAETLNFIKRNKENIDELRLTFAGCRIYPKSILATHPEEYNLANTNKDNWLTKDGMNTYEERIKRSEIVCQLALSLGMAVRINSRITRKAKVNR